MPLFNVAVREHTYTGRFYSDVVQAGSPEEALQVAAQHAVVPGPPTDPRPQHGSCVAVTGPTCTGRLDTDVVQASRRGEPVQVAAHGPPPSPAPQHGFSVVVREQADAGRFRRHVVQAVSPEEALQVVAAQAAAPEPPPGPTPRTEAAGRPRCADVWVYALLHCDLEAGHDPPHIAVAHGYRRPVRWMRDDLGIAHPVPDPATDDPVVSPITQPSPDLEAEPPEAPLTGVGP
jgi:hypothetical protein